MYVRGFLCKLSVTWHILPLFCHILFMAPPTAISVACCLGICGSLLRTTILLYCIIQQEVRIIHSGLIGCFLCSNNFTLPHCNTEQKEPIQLAKQRNTNKQRTEITVGIFLHWKIYPKIFESLSLGACSF